MKHGQHIKRKVFLKDKLQDIVFVEPHVAHLIFKNIFNENCCNLIQQIHDKTENQTVDLLKNILRTFNHHEKNSI